LPYIIILFQIKYIFGFIYIFMGIDIVSNTPVIVIGSTGTGGGGGGGSVSSVTNTDNSLTISPTTGAVVASISASWVAPVASGGTGQTTANTALNALLPSQSGVTSGWVLQTNGTSTSWTATASGATSSYTGVTTSTALNATHDVVGVDATSGSNTITLPTAVGISGKRYTIKKIDSTANTVTIATTSSQTIDGATSLVIDTQYASYMLISTNANWYII
jgi:hypothetical protein